jgi:hypothetical protein
MKYRCKKYILAIMMIAGLVLVVGCQPKKMFGTATTWKGKVRTYYTETSDGWTLQIDRFEPDQPDPLANPVVLCHGLSYNKLDRRRL